MSIYLFIFQYVLTHIVDVRRIVKYSLKVCGDLRMNLKMVEEYVVE